MGQNLGTAAQVAEELKNKAVAAGTLKADGTNPKAVEADKKAEPVVKVKLTDVIIAVIMGVDYLADDLKAKLVEDINAKLIKVTTPKVTAKSTVYDMLKASGETGVTKDQMAEQFMAREPKPSTSEMISFITNLNWFVQPSFYKKEGWDVFVKEGGFYGIKAKK